MHRLTKGQKSWRHMEATPSLTIALEYARLQSRLAALEAQLIEGSLDNMHSGQADLVPQKRVCEGVEASYTSSRRLLASPWAKQACVPLTPSEALASGNTISQRGLPCTSCSATPCCEGINGPPESRDCDPQLPDRDESLPPGETQLDDNCSSSTGGDDAGLEVGPRSNEAPCSSSACADGSRSRPIHETLIQQSAVEGSCSAIAHCALPVVTNIAIRDAPQRVTHTAEIGFGIDVVEGSSLVPLTEQDPHKCDFTDGTRVVPDPAAGIHLSTANALAAGDNEQASDCANYADETSNALPSQGASDSRLCQADGAETVWVHPLASLERQRLLTAAAAADCATDAPREVRACVCLPDARIAVLYESTVALWEAVSSEAASSLSWRVMLYLDGAAGAQFYTMASMPLTQAAPSQLATFNSFLVACGTLGDANEPRARRYAAGIADVEGAAGAPLSPVESAYGVSVFRLDVHTDCESGWMPDYCGALSDGLARAQKGADLDPHSAPQVHPMGSKALHRQPASRVPTDSKPTCAALLSCPSMHAVREPGGVMLAVGSIDGHVLVRRLSTPPSEQWQRLPSPHEEHVQLRCVPSADTHAKTVGSVTGVESGRAKMEGRPVLSLCALSTDLGLLVGGFSWGIALWQLPSCSLINVYIRDDFSSTAPSLRALAQELRQENPGSIWKDYMTAEVNRLAELVVALPLHAPARDTRGEINTSLGAPLGSIVVAGMLCSESARAMENQLDFSSLRLPAAAVCETHERAACVLARKFIISRQDATRSIAYCAAAYNGSRADTSIPPPEWSHQGKDAALTCLAANGVLLTGLSACGVAYVWCAESAQLIAVVPADDGLVPAMITPLLSTERGVGAVIISMDRCNLHASQWQLRWPAGCGLVSAGNERDAEKRQPTHAKNMLSMDAQRVAPSMCRDQRVTHQCWSQSLDGFSEELLSQRNEGEYYPGFAY